MFPSGVIIYKLVRIVVKSWMLAKKKVFFSQQWQSVPKSMGTDQPSDNKTQGGKKRGGSLDLL